MKLLISTLLVIWLVLLNGCLSYTYIKPVAPKLGNPNKNPKPVTSLQPTFSWEAGPYTGNYDLIIYEGIKDESFWKGVKRTVGDQVFYMEDIRNTSYTLESSLKPGTEYYWSVRQRNGNELTRWSTYNYDLFLILSYIRVSDSFFRFRTPGAN